MDSGEMMTSNECVLCGHDEEVCEAESNYHPYACVREQGHGGEHGACTETQHRVVSWRQDTGCEYCGTGYGTCGAKRDGHFCMRGIGHDGEHVACGTRDHAIKRWTGECDACGTWRGSREHWHERWHQERARADVAEAAETVAKRDRAELIRQRDAAQETAGAREDQLTGELDAVNDRVRSLEAETRKLTRQRDAALARAAASQPRPAESRVEALARLLADNTFLTGDEPDELDWTGADRGQRDAWRGIAARILEEMPPDRFTADDVDDAMVLTFMNTFDELADGSKPAPSLNHFLAARTSITRSALIATLTPARPEWADAPAVYAICAEDPGRERRLWWRDEDDSWRSADGEFSTATKALTDVTPLYPKEDA